MTKIAIIGAQGRMGQLIATEAQSRTDCTISHGIVRHMPPVPLSFPFTADVTTGIAGADVVIDFSVAENVANNAALSAHMNKPYITGITGLQADTIAALKSASTTIPVLYAANTSLSLAAMKAITKLAAQLLGPFDYDVAIHDEHHRMKKDAPSGTAKALGEAVITGNGGRKTPTYSATRAGYIVGEHEIVFAGEGETIRLHHSVTDRRIFARGALDAALWLANKPAGFYGMDDVLGM